MIIDPKASVTLGCNLFPNCGGGGTSNLFVLGRAPRLFLSKKISYLNSKYVSLQFLLIK